MVLVYERLMGMVVFFVVPALTLFAILTEPFIRFFLTEKWMPIVPLIQWLCFARMITPISALNMNILNAIGRSDLFFWVDISKLPLTIMALVITVPLGLTAVVIGHFATSYSFAFSLMPIIRETVRIWRDQADKRNVASRLCDVVMSLAVFISTIISSDFYEY